MQKAKNTSHARHAFLLSAAIEEESSMLGSLPSDFGFMIAKYPHHGANFCMEALVENALRTARSIPCQDVSVMLEAASNPRSDQLSANSRQPSWMSSP